MKEVIYIFEDEDSMNMKEAELVTEDFCRREDTYNICNGGKGGWSYINREGLTNTEEMRRASSERFERVRPDRVFSRMYHSNSEFRVIQQEHLARVRVTDGFKGKSHNDQSKKRIGEANSRLQAGEKNSQFGTFWITDGKTNKKSRGQIPEGWRRGRSKERAEPALESGC